MTGPSITPAHAEQLYRLIAGAWRSSSGGLIIPPYPSIKGRITKVSAVATYTAPPTRRSDFGAYKPDAANTGVLSGSALTSHFGDVIVTGAGTVLDSMYITGRVLIRAANVTIRNCKIVGTTPGYSGGNTALVDCNHSAVRNALIQDCLLVPDSPTLWLDGVIGHDYTARRCETYNVVDGFGAYSVAGTKPDCNVTIEGCYVHDLAYYSVDPNHANGPSHNDCVQIQGGTNIRIVGNNFQAYNSLTAGTGDQPYRQTPQGVTITPNQYPATGCLVSQNWIEGGQAGITMPQLNPTSGMYFGEISNNAFGMDQHDYGSGSRYQIRYKTGATIDGLFTNYFDPAALSVPTALKGVTFAVGRDAGIRIDP